MRDFSLVAEDARAVLNSQYATAKENGTRITFDLSRDGETLDLTSLSDRAVAAIALNQDGLFKEEEVTWASATLTARQQAALAPAFKASFAGDPRPLFKAYLESFETLEPEVKQALGMTEEHRLAVEEVLAGYERDSGPLKKGFSLADFLKHLDALAQDWKERHPDGYNVHGEGYFDPSATPRSHYL